MFKKGIDFTGIGICWICFDEQGNFVMQQALLLDIFSTVKL